MPSTAGSRRAARSTRCFNFDAVLRDPQDPAELLPAYDSGDHLQQQEAARGTPALKVEPVMSLF
jgi:hypothetical protein